MKLSGANEEVGAAANLVHQLADITDTSAALGIFHGTLASSRFLFGQNFLQYRGSAVETDILFYGGLRVPEAITDHFFHVLHSFCFVLQKAVYSVARLAIMKSHDDAVNSPAIPSQTIGDTNSMKVKTTTVTALDR